MHQLFTTCVKQTHTQNEPREEGKCTEFCHGSQRRKRKGCVPEFYLKIEVISNQFTGKKKFHFSRVPAEQSPTASAGLETKIPIRIITVVACCIRSMPGVLFTGPSPSSTSSPFPCTQSGSCCTAPPKEWSCHCSVGTTAVNRLVQTSLQHLLTSARDTRVQV